MWCYPRNFRLRCEVWTLCSLARVWLPWQLTDEPSRVKSTCWKNTSLIYKNILVWAFVLCLLDLCTLWFLLCSGDDPFGPAPVWSFDNLRIIISSVECNKVVSDIFGKFWVFDEILRYGFIRTFCTTFESYNPFSFWNVKIKKKRCKKRRKCKKHVYTNRLMQ